LSFFSQLVKRLRAYPPNNVINLFKTLNKDIQNQIIKIWKEERILEMSSDAFIKVFGDTKTIFN
jgi:hypothetical protein